MPGDHPPQKNTPTTRLAGFQKPNEILTPNHFFDVCLPHASIQVIRVVSYLIQETLGYTKDNGDPFRERFRASYKQIADEAGVPPSAVKKALDQAVEGRFLNRLRPAVPSSKGHAAESGEYELRWHEYKDGQYIVDPRKFRGFFAAEGNRTSIPEEFFSHVVRHDIKSVVRFVGAVIRNTIGVKASFGKGRVTRADLSYRRLQNYLNMSHTTLASAIKKAIEANYVVRLAEGVFDRHHPENNRCAAYTVKWCQRSPVVPTLSTPKTGASAHTKNWSEPTPKTGAGTHTKNWSPFKRFPKGNQNKQQEPVAAESSLSDDTTRQLCSIGFSERDAESLTKQHPPEIINQQIAWLAQRGARNPIGMLRRAIEENWDAPGGAHEPPDPAATAFAKGFYSGKREDTASLSEPSRRDLEAADRLVHQLSKIHGTRDPIEAASWGRGFGNQLRQQYPTLFPSLAHAASVLIDDLVRSHQRQSESDRIRTQLDLKNRASTDGPESEKQLWLEYLAQKEPELKKRFPSIHKAFESKRASLQTEFKRFGMPGFEQRLIDHHQRPATRLADLQKAFPEHLLDFEAWQRQHQNQPTLSTNT